MINKKLKELVRYCMRSMERATPYSTPRIKFDNDEVNNLLGPKRVPSVSTKTGWRRYDHPSTSSSSSSWQAASWWKSSSGSRCFRFLAMAIPWFATGSVHRTPNPHAMSRSRTRDFSRVVCHSLSCHRLPHAEHVQVAQGPQGSSYKGVLSS